MHRIRAKEEGLLYKEYVLHMQGTGRASMIGGGKTLTNRRMSGENRLEIRLQRVCE